MATVKYNRAAYDYQTNRVAELTARLADAKETLDEIKANLEPSFRVVGKDVIAQTRWTCLTGATRAEADRLQRQWQRLEIGQAEYTVEEEEN